MVADGIENAIRALNNFDPAKSANPFAYFTQIIYYAFLRRITKEKTLLYTKQKMYTSMAVMGELYDDASGTDLSNSQSSYATEYMNDFVTEYEKNLEKKKVLKVKKKSGIELFYDDEDEEEV
jgi:DNA-directed RNA polymerase specialized sigma24 family protein